MNTDPATRNIAQEGLRKIENAILELLERNPEGLSNVEIADSLDLRSDFLGGSRNYLTYSVLGGLLRQEKVRREGELRTAKYMPLPRSDEEPKVCNHPQRLEFRYDPAASTWHAVDEILQKSEEAGKSGSVAQHLVGAKLQLRFPDIAVANNPVSAADQQTGRAGDFQIGDTAFHVTVTPTRDNLLERVKENIRQGLRVYVVVPDEKVATARGYAEEQLPDQASQIAVCALEAFVAQNIDELSLFAKGCILKGFRALLEEYNQRVAAVESDSSLLIEVPAPLLEH